MEDVLRRIATVATFLTEIGIPFIGHDEHIETTHNSRCMILIVEFETCLVKHLD